MYIADVVKPSGGGDDGLVILRYEEVPIKRNAHEREASMRPGVLRSEPASMCFVLLTGIGDVVHGLPVVNAIRSRWPELRITWVAEPAPAEVLRHHPAVDDIVVFRKADGFAGIRRLAGELRLHAPFDVTFNAQRYFKSVWPTVFSRARVRVGLPRDKTRDGVSLFNTHHLPDGPWQHTQDMFLGVLDLLGVGRPGKLEWSITLSSEEEAEAAAFFRAHDPDGSARGNADRPRVGLVTGTANPAKDWQGERYPPLADVLGRAGWRVYLLGGPGEREREVATRTMERARVRPVPAMADSVRELIWKIRGMDLLISPDTGPVHIARALGVPVIGLYGHTNPWRVGPHRAFDDLVVDAYTDPGDEPDASRYEPKSGRMETIEVDDVLARVERVRRHYGIAPVD